MDLIFSPTRSAYKAALWSAREITLEIVHQSGVEQGPWRGQIVRYTHSPTDLAWPRPRRGQTAGTYQSYKVITHAGILVRWGYRIFYWSLVFHTHSKWSRFLLQRWWSVWHAYKQSHYLIFPPPCWPAARCRHSSILNDHRLCGVISATLAQNELAECDQPWKNPLIYSATPARIEPIRPLEMI